MTIDSPVGPLRIVASDDGLRAVLWPDDEAGRVPLPTDIGASDSHAVLASAARELDEYFAGDRQHFDTPLDPAGTEFQRQAWDALRSIPYGETVSYGEQAERMGDKNKARAVGRRQRSQSDLDHRAVPPGGRSERLAHRVRRRHRDEAVAARP